MTESHYDTLGVDRGATDEEITRAFRRKAREHPDLGAAADGVDMHRLDRARRVLLDPALRAAHDADLDSGRTHRAAEEDVVDVEVVDDWGQEQTWAQPPGPAPHPAPSPGPVPGPTPQPPSWGPPEGPAYPAPEQPTNGPYYPPSMQIPTYQPGVGGPGISGFGGHPYGTPETWWQVVKGHNLTHRISGIVWVLLWVPLIVLGLAQGSLANLESLGIANLVALLLGVRRIRRGKWFLYGLLLFGVFSFLGFVLRDSPDGWQVGSAAIALWLVSYVVAVESRAHYYRRGGR